MTPSQLQSDSYNSWLFAIACLRIQHEVGKKLTPKEMLEALDREQAKERAA